MRTAKTCWLPALALIFAGCSDTDAADSGRNPAIIACNGDAKLCDRRFDEVVYPATHNAMSNADEGWSIPNQTHGMTRQLEDGIRAMLIDTHEWQGQSYLCHSICDIGNKPLVDGLREIEMFMAAHPNEVITLIVEDGLSPEASAVAFEESGLGARVHVHLPNSPWPTLRQMIERGERLVVAVERNRPPPDWYHHFWDLAWDTPYSFKNENEFSCQENRGSRTNSLFLLNHWIENPLATVELSAIANEKERLLGRARQCEAETGKRPNFVAVNHYSLGALFEVTHELNGL